MASRCRVFGAKFGENRFWNRKQTEKWKFVSVFEAQNASRTKKMKTHLHWSITICKRALWRWRRLLVHHLTAIFIVLPLKYTRILVLPTAGHYIEWQLVSQTAGGLPTEPTTKNPQLGTIGRVGESVRDLWRLRMMLSTWHARWKCSRGQRLKDLVTGGCRALRARNDHLNSILSGRKNRGSPAQCTPDSSFATLIKTTYTEQIIRVT